MSRRAHQVHIGVVPNGDHHVGDGAAQQMEAAGEEPDQHIQHLRGWQGRQAGGLR